ncbi:MAG TPA: tripeptide aminopeptidase PepT, partial [Planococcus sp. (in: firmicutes)]|nr:tripeptide aminopeptidase PepT [Planococcus sp. (in: firmicutes)]
MQEVLIERLTRYAKIDTQSDFESTETPSTPGQWNLLKELEKEMNAIGLEDVGMDDHGYLFGTVPANSEKAFPVIGFLAHVDTATDFTGKGVNPKRVDNFDGNDIQLSESITMAIADFPALKNYVGHTLITTDGTTLLGADNKAGIAEIMTAMEYLIEHPEIEHGKIRVAFTPDEEIGRGPHKFDVERFGADYA